MSKGQNSKLFTKNLYLTYLIQVLIVSCLTLLSTVIPLWLSDRFNADSAEIGLVLGLSGISTIIARPFMGFALDRWGRKKILYVSIFLFGAINFLYIFAGSLFTISLIRFFQCIPYAASTTAIITIATDMLPEERQGEGLSYFTTSTTIPLAVGPTLGLALYNINWAYPFIFSGSIGFVCLIAAFMVRIPDFKPAPKKFSVQSLFNKGVAIIALIATISFSALPGLFSYMAFYGKEISLNLELIGFIYASYAASLLLTRILGAKIINRQDPKISGVISLTFYVFGVFIIGVWRNIVGTVFGAFIMGMGAGIILPTLLMMALNLAPDKRGLCNALVYGGIDVANSLGSILFGTIAKFYGSYGTTYIVFSGFELIGLVLFWFFTIPNYEKLRQNGNQASQLIVKQPVRDEQ
jgi:predicted MFS family arabinose efflux permease